VDPGTAGVDRVGGGGGGPSGAGTVPSTPKAKTAQPRGSLPTDVNQPPLEFQWPPPVPVSIHTSNLRLNMMNQDPKDLHTARAIIEELRSKVRFQTEHIMKWRKAYAMQVRIFFYFGIFRNVIAQIHILNAHLSFIPSGPATLSLPEGEIRSDELVDLAALALGIPTEAEAEADSQSIEPSGVDHPAPAEDHRHPVLPAGGSRAGDH